MSSGTMWSWNQTLTSVLISGPPPPTRKRKCYRVARSSVVSGKWTATPPAHSRDLVSVHFLSSVTSPVMSFQPSPRSSPPHTASPALASKSLILPRGLEFPLSCQNSRIKLKILSNTDTPPCLHPSSLPSLSLPVKLS